MLKRAPERRPGVLPCPGRQVGSLDLGEPALERKNLEVDKLARSIGHWARCDCA